MNVEKFSNFPIMGILRGIEESMIEPLVETIINSGLKTIEITMNTSRAPGLIKKMTDLSKGKLEIGAGTVLSVNDLKNAINSGATFIVMPAIVEDVMEFCIQNKIPVFPGALTPNEIFKAWNMGATMVKVFPSKVFGAGYFKEVKAPLNDIKLMACGGVSADNVAEFFNSGADAVSFGASIFKTEWMKNKNFSKIQQKIEELIRNYKK